MIQVNLLPPEHRVKDRAPVSRLLGTVAALLVTFLAMGAYLYAKVFLVQAITETKKQREETKALDMKRAAEFDKLEGEIRAYKTREEKIDEIARTDAKYAPLLYSLTKMVWDAEDDPQGGFKAWFSNMSVALVKPAGRSRQKGDVAELKMKVATATDDFSRAGNFFRAVKGHPYFQAYFDVDNVNAPSATRREYTGFEPSAAVEFETKVQRLPTDELLKRLGAAAKAAAGAGKAPPGDGKAPPGDAKAPPAGGKKG